MNLGRFPYSSKGDTLRLKQGFFNIDIWKVSLHSIFFFLVGECLQQNILIKKSCELVTMTHCTMHNFQILF